MKLIQIFSDTGYDSFHLFLFKQANKRACLFCCFIRSCPYFGLFSKEKERMRKKEEKTKSLNISCMLTIFYICIAIRELPSSHGGNVVCSTMAWFLMKARMNEPVKLT